MKNRAITRLHFEMKQNVFGKAHATNKHKKELMEQGFEYITEIDNAKLFRKRK